MVHSDNKGLVLPPRVAHIQVVIVPITYKDDDSSSIVSVAETIFAQLKKIGVRVYLDDRDNYKPGFKYNYWELKGVPIRIEVGKKDLEKSEVRIVRRDNGEKAQMKQAEIESEIPQLLDRIHRDMYERAKEIRDAHYKEASNWEDFMEALNARNIVLTPWCNNRECEVQAKDRSKEESKKLMEEAGEEEE